MVAVAQLRNIKVRLFFYSVISQIFLVTSGKRMDKKRLCLELAGP